eukprot:TRINITY_DN29943_c0_g1_i1.p1 TRINITY_DN29943_c0_g1~~TRINITY_DN29943_c0_g1_i1.p1  ORF type:complete len:183 (-),score=58.47 TRINITY_DN29943_c0_g1_i1:396-944(-)
MELNEYHAEHANIVSGGTSNLVLAIPAFVFSSPATLLCYVDSKSKFKQAWQAAQALFNTDVLPNLGAAVAAADEEARRKREEEEAVAKAEAERLAALEAQRPVLELLEATARAMQEQQLREQAAREAAEHTAALVAEAAIVESYMGCGQLEASLGDEDDRARREGGKQMRSLVPSIGMRLFS